MQLIKGVLVNTCDECVHGGKDLCKYETYFKIKLDYIVEKKDDTMHPFTTTSTVECKHFELSDEAKMFEEMIEEYEANEANSEYGCSYNEAEDTF